MLVFDSSPVRVERAQACDQPPRTSSRCCRSPRCAEEGSRRERSGAGGVGSPRSTDGAARSSGVARAIEALIRVLLAGFDLHQGVGSVIVSESSVIAPLVHTNLPSTT